MFTRPNAVMLYIAITSGQNRQKKQSEVVRVFVNSALKIQCHIVKIHSYRLLFRRFSYNISFKLPDEIRWGKFQLLERVWGRPYYQELRSFQWFVRVLKKMSV